MKTRIETTQRLRKLMSIFAMEYLSDLDKIEEERKTVEEAENSGERFMIVLAGEQNSKVSLSCMKETRKAIDFMKNAENDVENWQLAGINAMLDYINVDGNIPFDLPTAICGILGTDF